MKKIFLSSLIFLVFFYLATYPYLLNLKTFFFDYSDLPQNSWSIWWHYNSIITGKIFKPDLYFNTNVLYQFPYNLSFFDITFSQAIIFLVFFSITKNYVLSINITIIVIFYLTYISCFYILDKLIKNQYASILGSIFFVFHPYIFHDHFPHSINLLGRYFIPIFFFIVFKLITQEKILKNLTIMIVVLFLNALTSTYYFVSSLITILLAILIKFIFLNLKKINFKKKFFYFKKKVIFFLIIFFIIFLNLYFYQGYLKFYKQGIRRDINTNIHYSGNLNNYLQPAEKTIFYIFISEKLNIKFKINQTTEKKLFLGFFNFLFFIIGSIYLLKTKKIILKLKIFIFSSLIIFFLLTLGPVYKNLKLPYYYVMKTIRFQRVPTRYNIFFYFIFCLISAYGVNLLIKKIKDKSLKNIIFLNLLIILLLEIKPVNSNHFLYSSYFVKKAEFYNKNKTIHKKLEGKNTIHFPSSTCCYADSESKYMTWSVYTREKIFNGYPAYLPDDYFKKYMREIYFSQNNPKIVLKNLKIDYVIIHKDILNDEWLKYTDAPNINNEETIGYLKKFYNKFIEDNKNNKFFEDDKTIIIKL